MKPITLTELVILLSQQQDGRAEKSVQIITVTEHGQRVTLGVGAVFSVKEFPGTVFIQTTAVKL